MHTTTATKSSTTSGLPSVEFCRAEAARCRALASSLISDANRAASLTEADALRAEAADWYATADSFEADADAQRRTPSHGHHGARHLPEVGSHRFIVFDAAPFTGSITLTVLVTRWDRWPDDGTYPKGAEAEIVDLGDFNFHPYFEVGETIWVNEDRLVPLVRNVRRPEA